METSSKVLFDMRWKHVHVRVANRLVNNAVLLRELERRFPFLLDLEA
jgi:hypothetical protein